MRVGVGQVIAASLMSFGRLMKGRKVRAPQGRVPDNVWGAQAHDKCSREQTADGLLLAIVHR
ncbi:hypothetical protein UA69_13645 [Photobacterium angustum]|nr:hypothetical protein UA69_13645 [Photobacterium angustum]KJG39376.1 hypothetical protein UA35_14245 [Photobacterium angustum]KJG52137.1 hypothetical protein UA34_15670 [Photobacterium angustum]